MRPATFLVAMSYIYINNRANAVDSNSTSAPPPPAEPSSIFGSLHITNSCKETLFAKSVGAYPNTTNLDEMEIPLSAGNTYTEPLRDTVFHNCSTNDTYNAHNPFGKVLGQTPVIKITKPPQNYSFNALQLLYAIGDGGEAYNQLLYDISVFNCAANISSATGNETDPVLELQNQIESCPGYQGGLAIWTSDDSTCPRKYCEGTYSCSVVYGNNETEPENKVFGCTQQYSGDLYVELCAANGNG